LRTSAIDLKVLRHLAASADIGNFGRTATWLGVQASTLSRSVVRLEDELGLTLLERGHFGLRLTDAGRAVMVHVERILQEVEAMKRTSSQYAAGKAGRIRLGVCVPPIGEPARSLITAWRKTFADVALTVTEANEREIACALSERRLDLALIVGRSVWPSVSVLPLYRERLFTALPAGHPLSAVPQLTWMSLSHETILVQDWEESHAAREYYAELLGGDCAFEVHSASKQTILALVGAGAGITLVAQSQTEASFPGVVFKPIDESNAALEFDLVWPTETEDPVVGRFVAFMREESRARNLF
jgi:DNA-binding transcriptional LysR family regulator